MPYDTKSDGESNTKNLVIRYFKNLGGEVKEKLPTEYTSKKTRAKCKICGQTKSRCIHRTDQTIGKSARKSNYRNTQEELWCLRTDIRNACLQLPEYERLILGLRYLRDYTFEEIGLMFKTTPHNIRMTILSSIKFITEILDYVPNTE